MDIPHNNELKTLLDAAVACDEQNGRIRLASLWQDRTAVLVFVRHFG